jgi:antitoxin CcdA
MLRLDQVERGKTECVRPGREEGISGGHQCLMKKCSFEDKRSGTRSQLGATLSAMPRADTMETSMPTNVSAQTDKAFEENDLGVSLSEAVETTQEDAGRESQSERWIEENRKAFAEYDEVVEGNGVFSEGRRLF